MRITTRGVRLRALAALLPLALVACDGLFEVEAPGRIADDDLNNVDALDGLVVGMSFDMAEAMAGTHEFFSLASGEMWHGGSYDWADVPRGIILDEDVDGTWGTMHQARWVAEDGIERMRRVLEGAGADFDSNELVARAYVFAAIANRQLGENVCQAVFDGGAPQEYTAHFTRGIEQATEAIRIGEAAGADDEVAAAYGARAAMRAGTGDWAGAVSDAQQVPTEFEYLALLNTEHPDNDLYYETHDRFEYTVWGTYIEAHPDDPRAPWHIEFEADGSVSTGANGATPHYQQDKYDSVGDDIPLVKGTEMLLLRAEAALRSNDIPGAYLLMNEARDFYGMSPLTPAATLDAAWDDLHFERGATLWLENRRLGDLRRWFNEGPSSPAYHDFLVDRATCVPISEEEQLSNDNIG